MNLLHLRYFAELARTQHFTHAAERLCITQPSLSHAIRQLEAGETHQLYVMVNGVVANAQAWASSDTSVAQVSQSGLVTAKGKGSAVITGMYNGSSVECLVSVVEKTVKTTTRYNVLILDASGSVRGKALKR